MNKKSLNDIYNAIQNANTIGITVHTEPDGDALGSLVALEMLCKQMSKEVIMYAPPFDKSSWNIFNNVKKLSKKFDSKDNIDLMIALDCANQSRILNYDIIRKNVKIIINIDHHPDNNQFGDINWAGSFSSVGEMLFLFLSEFNLSLNNEIARAIYISIYMDTGGFRYSNTSADTHRIVAKLLEIGVDSNKIISEMKNNKTIFDLNNLGKILLRTMSTKDNKIVWTIKKGNECKLNFSPISLLREMRGAEIAIVFGEEEPNIFKISFRAIDNANVQKIAKNFGGGGHLAAAGATVEGIEKEVVKKVIDYAKKTLN